MPPKTPKEGELNPNVKVLCQVLKNTEDLKIDLKGLTADLGLAQSKNVGRKINSIIEPYGFTYKAGKVIEATPDSTDASAMTLTPMSKMKQEASANDEDDDGATPSEAPPKGSAKKAKHGGSIKDEHDSESAQPKSPTKSSAKKAKDRGSIKDEQNAESAQPKSPTKGQSKKGIAKVKPRSKKRSAEDDEGTELQLAVKKNKKYDTLPPPRSVKKGHSGSDEDQEINRLLLQEHGEEGNDEGNGRADSEETAVESGGSGEGGGDRGDGSEED